MYLLLSQSTSGRLSNMIHRRFVTISISLIVLLSSSPRKSAEDLIRIDENPYNAIMAVSQPLPGIDLDVTYISREPRYNWDSPKKWPDPGEQVTFTAHIINKGTVGSGAFSFQWRIDDQVVLNGSANTIPPQGEATQIIFWDWQPGRHYVSFEVDPQNLISETAETNNKIEDVTDALTIGFWVEETVYDDFNNIENGAGTYSWEDWAQRIIQKMNWMFEQSVYPLAPNGILTRVRLDNITIAPDGTLFDQWAWHAPYDTIYDGRWGFDIETYGNGCQCCPTDICYDVPWWVIHELGHYLFRRVDIYALDVQGGDVKVLDENGNPIAGTPLLPYISWDIVHYGNRIYDLMHTHYYSIFSDYHAYSLNRDWPLGQRPYMVIPYDMGNYIYEIPAETKIRVLNNNDQPMANVEVSVYQTVTGDGSSGPYSQYIDNNPDIVGVTDSQGLFSLGNRPFGYYENYWDLTGAIILVKFKNLETGIYRYTFIEVTDLNLAYWGGQTETYIHELHFPIGPLELNLSDTSLEFTAFQGSNPSPKNIEVDILGEGTQYWSIAQPTVPWLRAIPSPSIVANHTEYPPGPLTLIVESSDLPIGSYLTEINVSAENVINSPQTLSIIVNVIEPPPPSTISGNVTDQFDIPVVGVLLSDEFGHTATTDVKGNYTFINLPAGTYTLTAFKTDYTFMPVSQMVTVPPDAVDINFKAQGVTVYSSIYLPLVDRNFSDSQSFSDTDNAISWGRKSQLK